MREIDPVDIVETIREGLLVLEPDLTVAFVNRAFCNTFAVPPEDAVGLKLYELGDGQWDIPELRTLLQTVDEGGATIEAFEVERVFPSIGRRVMLLNARKVYRPGNNTHQILLAIEDVTQRVTLERERSAAHDRIDILLQEMTHRIKNSLQIIGAMVRLEAQGHKAGQGKAELESVSHRITALGRLYSKLDKADTVEAVDAATYLDELCRDLIASVQKDGEPAIALQTDLDSVMLPTDRMIPLGLLVNELVTNALKFAFPGETKGTVMVALKRGPSDLCLTVADDGKGIDPQRADSGFGGRLVESFAEQLGGQFERESGREGTTVRLILPGV
jgi:chemotaxis protein methyltransferase CheR